MLIVFQIPMADLRAFRAGAVRRDRPHWPTPDPGEEFLRFFGAVRERGESKKKDPHKKVYKKKPLAWEDENFYLDARRALKLGPFSGDRRAWTCAFRRLLCDGVALVRLEVGFHIPHNAQMPETQALDVIATLLDTECTLRGDKTTGKLLHIGKRLARLYGRASAPRGTVVGGDEVVAGQPTVLVQFEDLDSMVLPKSLDFDSDSLAFMKSACGGVNMNIWFTNADFGDPRDTRTALLRLSAEHQTLKQVLRDIAAGKIALDQNAAQWQALQKYLATAERTLSKDSRFGIDQSALIRLTQTYTTLCGGAELKMLLENLKEIRPQLLKKVLTLVNAANAQQPGNGEGPEFQWRGKFPDIEYQSFFTTTGRTLMDVAWLADVTARLCPAVCLIEIPKRGRKATGFLVGNDLVLTNWHVIEESATDDRSENVADLRLRFTLSAQPARQFALAAAAAAVVKGSPIATHDYALLRVAEDVRAELGVKPFVCDGTTKPVAQQGIHIIQHSGGGPLKIAVDESGVTGVYLDAGTVQYISKAEGGSSGAPCIDDQKRLVAIHHAEVQKPLGSAREGVMLAAIYKDIEPFLTAAAKENT